MQRQPHTQPEPEPRNNWLDRLARLDDHFGKYARDAFGVFMLAAALMTFLALGKFTEGWILTPWADMLSLWLGWGAYLVVIAFGYVGFVSLYRNSARLGWGRVFALELASLLTLGLLAAIGGGSLTRAEAGADGGRIGWGLITLFWRIDRLWGTLLLLVLWILLLMTGFGIWALIERWLLKVAGEETPVEVPARTLEIGERSGG
ncbi:MAG: hypothetical protein U0X92_07835 [Anaerolineales bacterium]